MVVTAMGTKYAKRIHDGTITFANVPPHQIQNVKDSYMELYGVPLE